MSFYNTIEETGEELATSQKKAQTQQDVIYQYFLTCGRPLSPSMVLDELRLNCPITSVRRAMTNLTKEGKIAKIQEYVEGSYGKPEHLWRLNREVEEIQGSLLV